MSILGRGQHGRKATGIELDDQAKTSMGIQGVDSSIIEKMQLIQLTEKDMKLLKKIQPIVKTHIDRLVGDFYSIILKVERLKNIVNQNSTVERLRETLSLHIVEMFDGCIDKNFIDKRLKIAKVHYAIGLEPSWYMGAFQNIHDTITYLVLQEIKDRKKLYPALSVVNKILNFEQQIVLEAYNQENLAKLNSQFEEGKEFLKNQMTFVSKELVVMAEQTQAAVNILSTNIREVNKVTTESSQQTILAKDHADEGQEKMQGLLDQISVMNQYSRDMIKSIHRLGESSDQIASVVNIVRDIAEQTNILSLNSAIEAARAGEHGRGFAVLSQEVQRLAEQTKDSVDQIQDLITTSNKCKEEVLRSLGYVEGSLMSSITSSEHTFETFQSIADSIKQNGNMILETQNQMDELIKIVNDIEEATAAVTASAEQLKEAALT